MKLKDTFPLGEKKVEAVTDFIFLGSKITLDGECLKLKGACSLEEKL